MARYVDGFVIPIAKGKVAAYRKIAKVASKVWKDHGALAYGESVGEDMKPPCGVPFPKLTRCRRGETVVFSWIVYRSRAHRDRVNAAVMADPRIAAMDPAKMPFDCDRMTWGGFEVLVGW